MRGLGLLSFVLNILMSMQTRESANPVAVQLQFSCSLFNRFAHSAGPGVVGKRVEWMIRFWGSRPRVHLAARLGRGVGGAREGEVVGT